MRRMPHRLTGRVVCSPAPPATTMSRFLRGWRRTRGTGLSPAVPRRPPPTLGCGRSADCPTPCFVQDCRCSERIEPECSERELRWCSAFERPAPSRVRAGARSYREEVETVPYVPLSHPFIEHAIGTVRREYLDHALFWNSLDLQRKLDRFKRNYNSARAIPVFKVKRLSTSPRKRSPVPSKLTNFRCTSHCGRLAKFFGSVSSDSPSRG